MAASVMVAGGAASCSPRAPVQRASLPPPDVVCIFRPALSNRVTEASLQVLGDWFPGADTMGMEDGVNGFERCLQSRKVLILPSSTYLPLPVWPALRDYLEKGGAAVLTGCDPFQARVVRQGDRYVTEKEYFAAQAETAEEVEGFSDVQLWRHQNDRGGLRGSVRVARKTGIPWPAVQVEVEEFNEWAALVLEDIPARLGGLRKNSLAFYARGDEQTSQLVLECVEDDGACWYKRISLSEDWRLYVLNEALFTYARGAPTAPRNRRLKFSRMRKMSAGLFAAQAPQAPGNHVFGLSNLRLLDDERPLEELAEEPDLPLVSPAYRRHSFKARLIHALASDDTILAGTLNMQGPLPRPRGWGGEEAPSGRWIPVAEGVDAKGHVFGWPASLFVRTGEDQRPIMRWGWVGLNFSPATARPARLLLAECIQRLRDGLFLYRAGCSQMAFEEGQEIKASARWTSGQGQVSVARVMAELLNENRRVERRVVSAPSAYGAPVHLHMGRVGRLEEESSDMILRLSLLDARVPGKLYDQLEQPLKFIKPPQAPAESSRLAASGPHFVFGRRPVFLLGVHYEPVSVNGRAPSEAPLHWLEAAAFDPALIRRDFDRLEAAGVNALSLRYLQERQAPQLWVVLDEARKRGLWIHLYVEGLQPLQMDLPRARRLIEAARLDRQWAVFALDLAWGPCLGTYQERAALNAEWKLWLKEQFGSEDHAETVLGRPLWRIAGQVTGPSDEELASDGEHRQAVALYRRFVDDFISRRQGEIKRFLRSLECRQLMSARTGSGGFGKARDERLFPADPATGAVHFDFISLDAGGLRGAADQFYEAGFLTAYGRGVSDGKPVAWLEFGESVGAEPQPADYENQARVYRQMFDLAMKSDASGAFAWWYPGGLRVEEGTDMGMMEPDGLWRSSGGVIRRFAHQLRQSIRPVSGWRGREMDRSADARGLSGLWEKWKDVYRAETQAGRMEEIRPSGFGRLSTEVPLVAVGGVPYLPPSPLELMNAEWGEVAMDGKPVVRRAGEPITALARQRLQLELINTGPVTWDASSERNPKTVWVRSVHPELEPQYVKTERLPYGKSIRISWIPPDPGTWRLRPWLWGAGGFGEELVVEVRSR